MRLHSPFSLSVSSDGTCEIAARETFGALRAMQTLTQLVAPTGYYQAQIRGLPVKVKGGF